MKKVFITRRFPQVFVKLISDAGFSVDMWNSDDPVDPTYLLQKSQDVDGILCTLYDQINEQLISHARNLKVISTMSVGFDHIDLNAVKKRNIRVGYTPGVLTDATAELAVSLLLATSRRIVEGINAVKNGEWGAWKPFWLCGTGLKDSTVGIVGLGGVGKAIALRVSSFGVKTILASGSKRHSSSVQINEAVSVQMTDFQSLLKQSDFVIASCALNNDTKHLFNEGAFNLMKSSAIFINVARGGVVDQEALFNALVTNKITAAGLDVCTPEPLPTDHSLLKLSNCVVLPHMGSSTTSTRNEMAKLSVTNLITGLQDGSMVSELQI